MTTVLCIVLNFISKFTLQNYSKKMRKERRSECPSEFKSYRIVIVIYTLYVLVELYDIQISF